MVSFRWKIIDCKKIVLDSYAVLMYLNDEHGADLVEKILRESEQGKLE